MAVTLRLASLAQGIILLSFYFILPELVEG